MKKISGHRTYMKPDSRTVERDASKCQTKNHAWCGPEHNVAPPDFVNPFQRYKGKYKVSARDNQPDCRRLVEADFFKESCRIIHEGIKTAQLLKRLHSTSHDCSMVRGSTPVYIGRYTLRARRLTTLNIMDLNRSMKVVVFVISMLR